MQYFPQRNSKATFSLCFFDLRHFEWEQFYIVMLNLSASAANWFTVKVMVSIHMEFNNRSILSHHQGGEEKLVWTVLYKFSAHLLIPKSGYCHISGGKAN